MNHLHRNGVIAVSFVFSVSMLGCDLIQPKKPAKQTAAQPAAQVIDSTANGPSQSEEMAQNTLAKVGSWSITIEEFNERLEGVKKVLKDFDENSLEAKGMVLDEIIRQQLLVQEARQQKINEMKDIQAATRDFENTLLVQELAARLTENLQATEDEAREFYNLNPDNFVVPVEKKVREIVVSAESEAKEILVQVLQGTDMAQLARDRSKAKTAANGGEIGFIAQASFPQMQKELDGLNKGEVSRVFSGPDGFYIIKVEDVRGGNKRPFDEVREELTKLLTLKKQQDAVMAKIEEVAKKVKVQVNTDLLKE